MIESRVKMLRIVNLLLALVFIGVAFGGLVRMFTGDSLIPYATFNQIHPISGLIFVILVIAHIYLNFNWIKANYLKKKK